MRSVLLSMTALVLVACGEQKPAAPTPAPEVVAAPVEAAPEAVAVIAPGEVAAKIAGTWVSIDDPKSSITLTADGKWTDDYADPAAEKQEAFAWRALTGAAAQLSDPKDVFTPTATYLEVKRDEGPYYYELGELDAENLEMFYVGRGNRLAYTRKP